MLVRGLPLCVLLLAVTPGCQHVAPQPLSAERSADALVRRNLADPGLRRFLEEVQGEPREAWPPSQWTLEELTLAGLYFQPGLEAARAAAAMAEARVRTAGQLANPTLTAFPQRVSGAAAGVSPWLAAIQVDWTIETAGKRGHRRAAAEARADAARRAIPTLAWALRQRLGEAIVRATAAASRRAVSQRAVALQGHLVELLEDRLHAGAADRSTLRPERITWIGMRADVARHERAFLEARARLAAELTLPTEALEGAEVDFALDREPLDLDGLVEPSEARRVALLGRGDLLSLLAEYAASEADLRLELARQVPDLRLGPGYEFDQGANKWGLALSLDLPLLNQNQGGIAEAVARRREVAARFESLQMQVIAEIDAATASLRGARIELEEAQRLNDAAQERQHAVVAAFDAGASDRLSLLGAELEVERAAGVLIDAREQVHLAAFQLEHAIQPDRAFTRAVVPSASTGIDGKGTP